DVMRDNVLVTSQKGQIGMKKILLVALMALALGLASVGVGAPALAGGRGGLGGDVHTLAGGSPTGHRAGWRADNAIAGSSAGAGGDISRPQPKSAAPAIAGSDSVRNGAEPS